MGERLAQWVERMRTAREERQSEPAPAPSSRPTASVTDPRGSTPPPAVVENTQRQLASLGLDPGPIDGDMGPKTRAAVVAFQRANGLNADGIIGPRTIAALRQATAPAPEPTPMGVPPPAPALGTPPTPRTFTNQTVDPASLREPSMLRGNQEANLAALLGVPIGRTTPTPEPPIMRQTPGPAAFGDMMPAVQTPSVARAPLASIPPPFTNEQPVPVGPVEMGPPLPAPPAPFTNGQAIPAGQVEAQPLPPAVSNAPANPVGPVTPVEMQPLPDLPPDPVAALQPFGVGVGTRLQAPEAGPANMDPTAGQYPHPEGPTPAQGGLFTPAPEAPAPAPQTGFGMMFGPQTSAPKSLTYIRKRVVDGSAGEDGDTLTAQRAFDEGVERFVDQALLDGSPSPTADVSAERDTLAKFRSASRYSTDPDATIQRLVGMNATLPQVANWLIGSTRIGAPSHAVSVAEKLRDSMGKDQWQEVRRAAFTRLISPEGGTPNALADAFAKFLNGRGSRLASVLFSAKERETMGRLANTVRLMSRPEAEGSEASYGLAQAIRPYLTTLQGAFA